MMIVAEAGLNHAFDFQRALAMCDAAKEMGATHIKFQTWFREDWPDLGQFTKDEWKSIFAHCNEINMPWFSTPFDLEAMDFLKAEGMTIWKVPSGMVTNERFIHEIVHRMRIEDTLIISTGMSTQSEVDQVHRIACAKYGVPRIRYLHCVTGYPSQIEGMNLSVIKHSHYFGISDHTPGIEIPIAATALGAKIIEKHFTLDRNLPGPDQKASLEPHEFKEMVRCIRNVEAAMGDGIKRPTDEELKIRDRIRRRMEF